MGSLPSRLPNYAVAAGVQVIKASATEQHNNSTERSTTSKSYVKLKETLLVVTGIVRTSFDLRASDGNACVGKVYKNGVAVGTERLVIGTTWTTFTEDLVFAAGDLYQIYAHADTIYANSALVRNQKVLGTIVTAYEDTAGY